MSRIPGKNGLLNLPSLLHAVEIPFSDRLQQIMYGEQEAGFADGQRGAPITAERGHHQAQIFCAFWDRQLLPTADHGICRHILFGAGHKAYAAAADLRREAFRGQGNRASSVAIRPVTVERNDIRIVRQLDRHTVLELAAHWGGR